MNKKIRKGSKAWFKQRISAHITKEIGQLKLAATIYDILITYYKSRTFSFSRFKDSLRLDALDGRPLRRILAKRLGVSPHQITIFIFKDNLIIGDDNHQHVAFNAIAQATDVKTFKKYKNKLKEWEILHKDVYGRIEFLTQTKRILNELLNIYGVRTKSQKWRKLEADFSKKYQLSILYVWDIVKKI